MSLHCSLFKPLSWFASSSGPDNEPHLRVWNTSAKNFSYVISTERLFLIHYGSQKLEYRNQYLVTCHRTNFITCDCPWSICGSIFKRAIKVGWLYSCSMASNSLLKHHTVTDSYNDPSKINIEAPHLSKDANTIAMDSRNFDVNVEGLELAKEELFGYLDLIQNNPPTTLSKIE